MAIIWIELDSLGAGVGQTASGAVTASTAGTILLADPVTLAPTSTPFDVYATPGGAVDSTGNFTTDTLGRVPGWVLRGAADVPVAITIGSSDPVIVTIPGSGAIIVRSFSTTTDTLEIGDNGNIVQSTGSSAVVETVPANSDVAFAVPTFIEIWQTGSGTLTLAAAGGVTLVATPGLTLVSAGQNAIIGLAQIATNSWIANGNLVPA